MRSLGLVLVDLTIEYDRWIYQIGLQLVYLLVQDERGSVFAHTFTQLPDCHHGFGPGHELHMTPGTSLLCCRILN